MIQHVRKTKSSLLEGGGFNLDEAGFQSIVEVHLEALMGKIFQDNLNLAQRLHKHCEVMNSNNSISINASSYRTHSSSFYQYGSGSKSAGTVHSSVGGGSTSEGVKTALDKDCITPLMAKQLFNDPRSSSYKKMKIEKDKENEIIVENEAPRKLSYEYFFLPEDALTAIAENASCSSNNLICTEDHDYGFSKLICRQKRFATNPWKYGTKRRSIELNVIGGFYTWLKNNNLSTLRCNWIIHTLPKYIELNGFDLKDIFIEHKNFSKEAFDIAVRRISQLDFQMYGPGKKICWRHIFESDFADLVLSGVDPLTTVSVILQFTMCFNEYDISECRMIIIPALLEETWCLYYWDMQKHKVHVIDPSYDSSNESICQEKHVENIAKLKRSLSCLQKVIYEGWQVDWSLFSHNFLKPIIRNSQSYESGILTLLAIQKFNGSSFKEEQTKESLSSFEKLVLYEMLCIEGSSGRLPAGFVQYVN